MTRIAPTAPLRPRVLHSVFFWVSLYLVAGVLTFGWLNSAPDCADEDPIDTRVCSFAAGYLWPAYWAGKGSIELFRP